MKPAVVSLDERRAVSHAELDGLKARVARYEAALRNIILHPKDAFTIAAKAMSEGQ